MKLQIISAVLLFPFIFSCSTTKKNYKEVNQRFTNVTFNPISLKHVIDDNVILTIKPINAASKNFESYLKAGQDGNYENENVSINNLVKNTSNLSSREKKSLKAKLDALELINNKLRKGDLSIAVANALKNSIVNGKNKIGTNGIEISSLQETSDDFNSFNPYKINYKYLSVFEIAIENGSNQIFNLSLKDFQLVSGNELLFPLDINYFRDNLPLDSEKYKNALRYNLPNQIAITPKQKIIKYIATPAINKFNKSLVFQYLQGGNVTNYEFNVDVEEYQTKSMYEQYFFNFRNYDFSEYFVDFHIVLEKKNGEIVICSSKEFYIADNEKFQKFNVYSIALNSKTGKADFGKNEDFSFANNKREINIKF